MIKLDKGLCQIVLYCKGWFQTTDLIKDLKILIGKRCGYDPEHTTLGSIYWHLCEIVKECSNIHPNKNYIYQNILSEMFKWKRSISVEDIIKQLCSEISLLSVMNDKHELILELGEPDYTWLPKIDRKREFVDKLKTEKLCPSQLGFQDIYISECESEDGLPDCNGCREESVEKFFEKQQKE